MGEPLLIRYRAGTGPAVRNECVMMSDWIGFCKDWALHSKDAHFENLRLEPHKPAEHGHPRTYHHVSEQSWQELRKSGYWFGRKFTPGAFHHVRSPYFIESAQGDEKKATVSSSWKYLENTVRSVVDNIFSGLL